MQIFSPRLLWQASLLAALLLICTACASTGTSAATGAASPTSDASSTAILHATAPSATTSEPAGPQSCPVPFDNPTYWDTAIPTQPGVSQVSGVSCGYLEGTSTLQALVKVLYTNTTATLDVSVYEIDGAAPRRVFFLPDLIKGDARISGYNTLETAEVDQASSQNAGLDSTAWTPDLFREFAWSASMKTLVQVAFPGIFPDLTRYQAETDQQKVDQGEQSWQLSPTQTAQAFGAALLQWSPNASATLIRGGGSTDTQAEVQLVNSGTPAGSGITVSLARLEGRTSRGIWLVTGVRFTGLSITQPLTGTLIGGSVTIAGTGSAFESVIGPVTILNHLYKPIGQTTVHGTSGNGATTFSVNLTPQPTFRAGAEEGLILLTQTSNATGGVAGAALVKVLIHK